MTGDTSQAMMTSEGENSKNGDSDVVVDNDNADEIQEKEIKNQSL